MAIRQKLLPAVGSLGHGRSGEKVQDENHVASRRLWDIRWRYLRMLACIIRRRNAFHSQKSIQHLESLSMIMVRNLQSGSIFGCGGRAAATSEVRCGSNDAPTTEPLRRGRAGSSLTALFFAHHGLIWRSDRCFISTQPTYHSGFCCDLQSY